MTRSSSILQPIRLSRDKTHLVGADGSPFFWLADTWWFAATKRASWSAFKKMVADRKKKGFTVILLVVGVPPEVDYFSPDAGNSGGLPFHKDWSLNPAYFDQIDKKIAYLVRAGIVPCIVGGWGHHIDRMGVAAVKNLWREIVRRYAAYPVVFCLTGEVDGFLRRIPLLGTQLFRDKRLRKWDEVARYIRSIDHNKRPIVVHPQSKSSASALMGNPAWLDIDAIQSGHSRGNTAFMVEAILKAQKGRRPIINLEPWYEGILGNFGAYEQRLAFWMCVLAGAKGHTYGAHGLWQMANRDNFMGHWGNSDWRRALSYAGSTHLARAKAFLLKYPWWKIHPNPDRIIPHWDGNHTDFPMAAEMDKRLLVYFPKRTSKSTYMFAGSTNSARYELLWYKPETTKLVRREVKTGKSIEFSLPSASDWLLMVQKKK